jgi:hypothetical protein
MKKGDIVKMSEFLKQTLKGNGCEEHVIEFGNCIGIVEGKCYPDNEFADEVDVRWQPSGLRYAYFPEELVNISEMRDKKIKKIVMKTKDINWLNDKIEDIKKRKRNLKMLIDPEMKKKIRKDLKIEYRSVKRSNKQSVDKFIKDEIEKYGK